LSWSSAAGCTSLEAGDETQTIMKSSTSRQTLSKTNGVNSMKKLFWLVMLVPAALEGQASEFWKCQGTNAAGFNWNTEEGYRWESTRIPTTELMLKIDGGNSYLTLNSEDISLVCEEYTNETSGKFISCIRSSELAYDFLVLNPTSGQAALSQLGGSITPNTFYRELVTTQIFECENI
jgi:hypothetical protein|tara:strand:- start:589 stop:1122 length:534 start_codon:yes stop_codon:yes gene_type:complete